MILLLYLLGTIPGYFIFRFDYKETVGKWTTGARASGIFISLMFGWFIVICFFVSKLLLLTNNNKPAKW